MLIHFTIVYSWRADAMKVYVHDKGVILVGKAWEIRQKLAEYQRKFNKVEDWVHFYHQKQPRDFLLLDIDKK
jgi:hypothetical protein